MAELKQNISKELLEIIKRDGATTLGITGSPSTTLEITIDISEVSKAQRALGQMVHVVVEEDGCPVLVIGQIISIETQNRWHEDPSFKGVIKRHGKLPHLSGTADNRIATISVQACYALKEENPSAYILGTSPSTGEKVGKMTNEVMASLMKPHKSVTYMGKVYGTDVDLPFWFKHFGKNDPSISEAGAGDAYHIGIFGKTGSGKTVTAAYTLLGYAKNKKSMSILVLDPQKQFYSDQELLPGGVKLEDRIKSMGMNYEKYEILNDLYLPGDELEIFGQLLTSFGFIQEAFRPMYTEEKIEAARCTVVDYLRGRQNDPSFSLNKITDSKKLLRDMLTRFVTLSADETQQGKTFTVYVESVYGTRDTRTRLQGRINEVLSSIDTQSSILKKWDNALNYFRKTKAGGKDKISVDELVKKIVNERGNFMVLDVSGARVGESENENLPALFIKVIETKVVEAGATLYAQNMRANCLIVMDEAHKFISDTGIDERVKDLTKEIINSVRTTRKYGIGYMFITQSLESLNDEIIKQMRIFSFGYGLTSGAELKKVSELVNNPAAVQLYKSFIDPSSNGKFPFMFFGPVSPLSFTGSPLFLEVYGNIANFK
jgi:hypothetical protein